jgi:DNA repair exonuclease SbcCD ATPase subunit
MALIQRYSTELSAYAGANRNDSTSIAQVVNDVAAIKKQDEDEKRYFNSLNDRLEELLRSLDDLELANKKLRDELNFLITSWGIEGENRIRFLQELDILTQHLSEQNRRKVIAEAETKIFEELTRLTDRITSVFLDVFNSYEDKNQILFDFIKQLEDELYKIQIRLNISNNQVKSHDDDYQKELTKFRSYLSEWSKIALDKQNLLNEIQALKEHYNLRLAYNQEEINEWKRLLNRILQESDNFYRDYLETIIQQIQLDYEQLAKEQQNDVEIELKTRLKEIEEKINMGLPIDENDERRRREETQRFESRLTEHTKEYDQFQSDYRKLAEEIQRKRRILQDLENEARNKARKHAEQHARLQQDTDFTREEYYILKDELDKLAYTLRFSIEEELKIYEALLNSLDRQKNIRPSTDTSTGFQLSKTSITKTADIDDSAKYAIAQDMLGQTQTTTTTTTRTTKRTTQDSDKHIRRDLSELDEKYMQSKIRITRKYKGKKTKFFFSK